MAATQCGSHNMYRQASEGHNNGSNKVSQGGATEELADQVSTKTAAAHSWLEEASSHPHEKEKDEAHKSCKGHVSEPAIACHISTESLNRSSALPTVEMEEAQDTEKLINQSVSSRRTTIHCKPKRGWKARVSQRSRPPG